MINKTAKTVNLIQLVSIVKSILAKMLESITAQIYRYKCILICIKEPRAQYVLFYFLSFFIRFSLKNETKQTTTKNTHKYFVNWTIKSYVVFAKWISVFLYLFSSFGGFRMCQ